MTERPHTNSPTPYTDVNAVLHGFVAQLRSILGSHFRGMYLSGSLALGDFDPHTSDIDFIVLTDTPLSVGRIEALGEMHTRFNASSSPWAHRIEAVYIPPEALHPNLVSTAHCPQVEKDRPLFIAPLEDGWLFHLSTLREHGLTVAGSDIHPLIGPIDPGDMRNAAAPIAELWLQQSHHDPTWLPWLRERKNQSFVVLTLCRLLYTLGTGSVTSKPAAARWAQQALDPRWSPLIKQAIVDQHSTSTTRESDITETIALLQHIVDRFHRWQSTLVPKTR